MLCEKGSSSGLQIFQLILARNWGSDRHLAVMLCMMLVVNHLSVVVVVVFSMPGKAYLPFCPYAMFLLQNLHQAVPGMSTFANHTS